MGTIMSILEENSKEHSTHFPASISYNGRITHPSFGEYPLSMSVHLENSASGLHGHWLVMGSRRVDITVSCEEDRVVFSDGDTHLIGTFETENSFKGDVT